VLTSILAIVIAVVGIAVIIAGAWGAVVLIAQKADTPGSTRERRSSACVRCGGSPDPSSKRHMEIP
jgi:hypothetical protein